MKSAVWALLLFACGAFATTYTGVIDDRSWRVEESVFACRLLRPVDTYGDAVFETRAGEASHFRLQSNRSRMRSGPAQILARSPAWTEIYEQSLLGQVELEVGRKGLALDSTYAEAMLLQLYNGRDLVISQRQRPEWVEQGELNMPVVGFRPAYRAYQACLANLLPVNYDQVARTSVYFGPNQAENLPEGELRKLDRVVLYALADNSVKEFYIDGHTDSVDTRHHNLELSQKRAEEVKRYLVTKGIPEQAIISRWHGERYPVESNATAEGRAGNRRVTVRLERAGVEGAFD